MLLTLLSSFFGFYTIDSFLTKCNVQGVYYFVHLIHNCLIVNETWNDVVITFTDFHNLHNYPINENAIALCISLHLYHITMYYKKLRFDDWLHHILMIFCALPIGYFLPSSTLIGFSLFFSTGLPSILDYALLFLVRNNYCDPLLEKKVNTALNVWLRSPGCVAHAALTVVTVLSKEHSEGHLFRTDTQKILAFIPAALMYWNGQFFMQQVVRDYTKRIEHQHPL
jgi:hypothetical protein